jgi:hypothetical protein
MSSFFRAHKILSSNLKNQLRTNNQFPVIFTTDMNFWALIFENNDDGFRSKYGVCPPTSAMFRTSRHFPSSTQSKIKAMDRADRKQEARARKHAH